MPTVELERPEVVEERAAPASPSAAAAAVAHMPSAPLAGVDPARARTSSSVRSITSIFVVAVLLVAANLAFHSLGQSPTNGLSRWQERMILDADNVRFAAGWLVSLLFLAAFAVLRIVEAHSSRT